MRPTPQFGQKLGQCKNRPGAYLVLFDHQNRILAVFSRGRLHLPGGGIEHEEDPIRAVIRETREETGYAVAVVGKIGRARQFLQTTDLGPINKLGEYFLGHLIDAHPQPTQEPDHKLTWVEPEDFITSTAHDFHKWAVQEAIRQKESLDKSNN
jgi:8-oxo-dGTP diphosphatase